MWLIAAVGVAPGFHTGLDKVLTLEDVRVGPPSWACPALRAPREKCTAATLSWEVGRPRVMGSTETSPVNVSAVLWSSLVWRGVHGAFLITARFGDEVAVIVWKWLSAR
jgi:hypothetical protein